MGEKNIKNDHTDTVVANAIITINMNKMNGNIVLKIIIV